MSIVLRRATIRLTAKFSKKLYVAASKVQPSDLLSRDLTAAIDSCRTFGSTETFVPNHASLDASSQ